MGIIVWIKYLCRLDKSKEIILRKSVHYEENAMFSTPEYEQKRQAVIDLSNRYIKSRDELWHTTNQQDGRSEADLQRLKIQIDLLKENKYLLAVVGESKSGKSAFINGLLKKKILPTGALQCTSSIIEILDTDNAQDKGETYLKVTYANGREEEETEIINIQEKLERIGAISPEYRHLPIVQLNQFLMEKNTEKVTDVDIQNLLSRTEENSLKKFLENPHDISDIKFKYLVREYLEEYCDLSEIPIQIVVGCPLGLQFKNLRLIDTPGVNARGGLKKATIKSIVNATAVIFIHSTQNIASESLEHFLKTDTPEHVLKNIFMFLTHKAYQTEDATNETLTEARNLFPQIAGEKIIAVDSILKRIYDEILEGKSPEELFKNADFKTLIAQYLIEYRGKEELIPSAIYKDSNFSNVERVLKDFSDQALIKQLCSLVSQIMDGYKEQYNIYEKETELINSKITKTPSQFDREIQVIQQTLQDYLGTIDKFCTTRGREYTGLNSTVYVEFSKIKTLYLQLLDRASDENSIRKHILDFNNDCERQVLSRIGMLNIEYMNEMEKVGAEYKEIHSINPPKISLEDVASKARERAYEMKTIPGDKAGRAAKGAAAGVLYGALVGFASAGPIGALIGGIAGGGVAGTREYLDGNPASTQREFNEQKYKEALVSEAKILVDSIAAAMVTNMADSFNEYNKSFQQRLGEVVIQRQKAYDELKDKKKEAEEQQKEIELLSSKLRSVDNEIEFCSRLKENLSYN